MNHINDRKKTMQNVNPHWKYAALNGELELQVIEKIEEYLNGGYQGEGELIPTLAGLADYLDYSQAALIRYGKESDPIADMLDRLQTKQEKLLISNGLSNRFNANLTKLMLFKHGYSERIESTVTEAPKTITEPAAFIGVKAEPKRVEYSHVNTPESHEVKTSTDRASNTAQSDTNATQGHTAPPDNAKRLNMRGVNKPRITIDVNQYEDRPRIKADS